MNLTRDQAISEHRKMWNWIADETENHKRKVLKIEYFLTMGINDIPFNECYCCEFNEQNDSYDSYCGNNCIINWESGMGCMRSYFFRWIVCDSKNWQEATRLARIIANLPERKENAD